MNSNPHLLKNVDLNIGTPHRSIFQWFGDTFKCLGGLLFDFVMGVGLGEEVSSIGVYIVLSCVIIA